MAESGRWSKQTFCCSFVSLRPSISDIHKFKKSPEGLWKSEINLLLHQSVQLQSLKITQ
jgi:hypothetical protein